MRVTPRAYTVVEMASVEARCRWCRAQAGNIVLDLGDQPASDNFPLLTEQAGDPLYPLQMWLCSSCGLVQLLSDPTVPEEPLAAEPAALVEQATTAVRRLREGGWLEPGQRALEFGSPHGGSWLPKLVEHGLTPAVADEQAEIVLDCFGLMHCADQEAALRERASRVAPEGTLFVQFHSLATILRHGQWNSLRHGHYAYYSATVLAHMLASVGFRAVSAWEFDLYGGTVLLAAQRATDSFELYEGESVERLIDGEAAMRITSVDAFRDLYDTVSRDARAIRSWLDEQRVRGRRVAAYGAASRAVALLCLAEVRGDLLPVIGDASDAKQGRRMPGTDSRIISPTELIVMNPEVVLLLLPDLLDEVRATLPEIEASGGRWVSMDDIKAASLF